MLKAYQPDGLGGPTGGSNPAVEALAGAITAEVRLLEDLIGVMRR